MLRRKYYKKLFLIYFIFALVYGLILTSYFVYQNKSDLDAQKVAHHMTISEQTVKNLEQRLWSLSKYTDTLFLDDDFNNYLITEGDYYLITQVHDKLRTDMAVFADMGARIAVSKMKDDMVITNQYTRNLDLFYEEMAFGPDMIEAFTAYYEKEGNYQTTLLLYDQSYDQVHLVKKKRVNNKEYLILLLSIDKGMLQMVNGLTAFEFTFDGREDAYGEIASAITQDQKGYLIQEDKFYILRQSSIYPQLSYLVYLPYSNKGIGVKDYVVAVLLFIALSVISFVSAMIVSRNLYKPIKKAVDRFDTTEVVEVDEFAYLERMTSDIMSANTELKVTIEEHQVDLRTKFIREMLYGLKNELSLSNGVQAFGLEKFSKPCQVVLIELEEMDSYKNDYLSETRARIRTTVQVILNKSLAMESGAYELIEVQYNAYALIVNAMEEKALRAMLMGLLKAVEANDQVDLVMAIGKVVPDYRGLETSYNEAQAVRSYKASFDKRAIVTMTDVVDQGAEEKFHYSFELERDVYNATINGSAEKIKVLFQKISKMNFIDRHLSSREQLNLLMGMMTTLRRIEQKMPGEIELAHDDFKALMVDGNLEGKELLSEIEKTFESYAILAREKSASKDDEISSLMVNYIEDHFNEDISLEEAASYLNISAGYFCTVFKKQTGTSFKSYLNSYRVAKAKEILRGEPTIKIKDLTLRVGYNNVNSFIRMFKKNEGISPGEYGKRNQS